MIEISNEPARALSREGQRIAPEIPLKRDDGEAGHANPNHTQSRFPSCEARVEEAETRYHDHDHGRSHDDVGLIS